MTLQSFCNQSLPRALCSLPGSNSGSSTRLKFESLSFSLLQLNICFHLQPVKHAEISQHLCQSLTHKQYCFPGQVFSCRGCCSMCHFWGIVSTFCSPVGYSGEKITHNWERVEAGPPATTNVIETLWSHQEMEREQMTLQFWFTQGQTGGQKQ